MSGNLGQEFASDNSSEQDLKHQFNEELFQGNQQLEPARVVDDFVVEPQGQNKLATQAEVQEEKVKEEEEEQVMIERQGIDDAQKHREADAIPHDPDYDAYIDELLQDAHDNDSVTSGELARYEQSIRVTIQTAEVSHKILKTAK